MTLKADTLTDLPMRPAFNEALQAAIGAGEPVALALIDVDRFAAVNEQLGHDAGDEVLRRLATLLSEAVADGVYRTGGDEFTILLPGMSLEQAFLRMEALRARVHAADWSFVGELGPLSITVGVAQYPRDARDGRGLVTAADAALLAGKEIGRNSVSLPPNEEMVMKSCYYSASSLRRLKQLAERTRRSESQLLREALEDLFRKYDSPRSSEG